MEGTMNKLSGYVLVKETNVGIPNLVVAVFDSERSLASAGEKGTFSFSDCGKRIGSVLTDRDGRFSLQREGLEFQGNEARPDLVLVVFAPEDVGDLDHPVPLAPAKRVLYVSATPLTDAGGEEAIVIRLLQAQLQKFAIPLSTSTHGTPDAHRLASVLEGSWQFRDVLKTRLGPRAREEHAKGTARTRLATEKLKSFSGIPRHLRDGALKDSRFLIVGHENLKDQLKTMQDSAITRGIQKLGTRKPTLRLDLSEADLADLGLKVDGDVVSGQVDTATLAKKIRSLSGGVDLVRVRGLNNPPADELEKKYLGDDAAPSTGDKPVG